MANVLIDEHENRRQIDLNLEIGVNLSDHDRDRWAGKGSERAKLS